MAKLDNRFKGASIGGGIGAMAAVFVNYLINGNNFTYFFLLAIGILIGNLIGFKIVTKNQSQGGTNSRPWLFKNFEKFTIIASIAMAAAGLYTFLFLETSIEMFFSFLFFFGCSIYLFLNYKNNK